MSTNVGPDSLRFDEEEQTNIEAFNNAVKSAGHSAGKTIAGATNNDDGVASDFKKTGQEIVSKIKTGL